MKIHELKIIPKYYQDVKNKIKTFECRFNDRDFKVNDLIILNEYDLSNEKFTGNSLTVKIIYILDDFVGLKDGFVVLSIELI